MHAVLLLLAAADPAADAASAARSVLASKPCASCHRSSLPTAQPDALAVFDLDQERWHAGMDAHQLAGLLRRASGFDEPSRHVVEEFVRLETAKLEAAPAAEATGAESPCVATAPLEPTPDVGTGPNHRPGAPFRSKLSPEGAAGTPLNIGGQVLDADTGRPIAGAVLDAYHADARGHYDADGFDYRGKIRTDEQGRYEIQTIRPAGYGPPPHIHVIVTAEGYVTLRTEIRFTSDERATNDRPELTPALVETGNQLHGTFDIVLRR